MKENNCQICGKETEELWALNTAMYNSLELSEQGVKVKICERCAADIGEVVNQLKKLNQKPYKTQMQKSFDKANEEKKPIETHRQELKKPPAKKDTKKIESETDKPISAPQRSKGFAQNEFLKKLHHSQKESEILGIGNEVWKGTLEAYDDYSLVLKTKYGTELIFKHAIKCIKPAKKDLKEKEVFKQLDSSVRSFSQILPH